MCVCVSLPGRKILAVIQAGYCRSFDREIYKILHTQKTFAGHNALRDSRGSNSSECFIFLSLFFSLSQSGSSLSLSLSLSLSDCLFAATLWTRSRPLAFLLSRPSLSSAPHSSAPRKQPAYSRHSLSLSLSLPLLELASVQTTTRFCHDDKNCFSIEDALLPVDNDERWEERHFAYVVCTYKLKQAVKLVSMLPRSNAKIAQLTGLLTVFCSRIDINSPSGFGLIESYNFNY